jgi:hypothetical protein
MFSKYLIDLILDGKKTMTSRDEPQCEVGKDTNLMANQNYSEITGMRIIITKLYEKTLSQFTDIDANKEGFKNLMVFKQYWEKYLGEWIPNRIVWVHEFQLLNVRG